MECLFLDFCVLDCRLSGSRQEENVKQTDYELYDVVKEKMQRCIVIDSDTPLHFLASSTLQNILKSSGLLFEHSRCYIEITEKNKHQIYEITRRNQI